MSTQNTEPSNAKFRLSPQQEHLWLAQPQGPSIKVQCVVDLPRGVDPGAVCHALGRIVMRHEILRTTFDRAPGMRVPGQVIQDKLTVAWHNVETPAPATDEALDRLMAEEAQATVGFADGPLVRALLIGESDERPLLVVTASALCADARSLAILVSQLRAELAGAATASDEPLQYADYAEWRNEQLGSGGLRAEEVRQSWAAENLPPAPALPFVVPAAAGTSHQVRVRVTVDPVALQRGAATLHVSAALFVEACWHVLLARLSGQGDLLVATVLDGRAHEELRAAIGPFAQVLPVRTEIDDATSFAEAVDRLRRVRTQLELEQDIADAAVLRDIAAQCSVGFAAVEIEPDLGIQALVGAPVAFPVQLCWLGSDLEARAELHVAPTAVSDETAAFFADALAAIIEAAVGDSSTAVGDLPLSTVDTERTFYALVGPKSDPPAATVATLFDDQVGRTPERVALVAADDVLTYRDLNVQSNRVAHRLRALGVTRETVVAVCTERSSHSIVGLLGVLKAGGAYLPLNFEHPPARLVHQLTETGAPVFLTQSTLLDRVPPPFQGTVLCLDREDEGLGAEPLSDLEPLAGPESLVYVMYTSGSTGLPKGVGVTHSNLANYTVGISAQLGLGDPAEEPAAIAAVSALSTDLGNTSIFPALLSGSTLHLVPPEVSMDGGLYATYVEQHPIDVLKITPSHLRALLAGTDPTHVLPRRWLVLGGEALSWELIDAIEGAGSCRILNHYGPTETTVGTCTFEVGTEPRQGATVPIGRPLPGTRAYVVNRRLELLPPGVPGELCIGGAGVARGYFEQPEQTAESFLHDPLPAQGHGRLYRTGDRARVLRDGNVEFLGRLDQQVKIRGYRVEPAEIEAVLATYPGVRQAAVVAREDTGGDLELVAYVAASNEVASEELQAHVRASLPAYMVPGQLVRIDALPLTTNGKIDRRALPEPGEPERLTEYVAPRTPLEEGLARIWEELLGVERIGVFDDFFALGGHSLLATQAVIRIRNTYAEIPLQSLFNSPTVAGLAEAIVQAELDSLETEGLSPEGLPAADAG